MRHIERANERGTSELGWLSSHFTYSFADYLNPKRMGFGVLRVVNDDAVAPKSGFPLHHHENMEIVTIMLSGTLTHEDSMGNKKELHAGEVQVMTAGTGVNHSERNHDFKETARLFQIWIFPNKRGLPPRYDQKKFDEKDRQNTFQVLVSGDKKDGTLFIHQDAVFARASIKKGEHVAYKPANSKHGLFLMVVTGKIKLGGDTLNERDMMEIQGEPDIEVEALEDADVFVIEVPVG
ncbi:MAG: pirin family protein [bacterium]|nr:pirin family protein [bacterium]